MKPIFPKPQYAIENEGVLCLCKGIRVVHTAAWNVATENALKNFSECCGIALDDAAPVTLYTAVYGEESEAAALLCDAVNADWLNHYDGYRLAVLPEKKAIVLLAQNESGIFYGFKTLKQIVEDKKIPAAYIEDYADMAVRGTVEGFYGFPWSYEGRRELMRFGAEWKMNTYLYAPKDDPYHRASWRDLYPEAEQAELRAMVKTAQEENFDFTWTLHPGDTIDLDSEEDFASAVKKLTQLYEIGVRRFGILFDDIHGEHPDGKKQAEFMNRIDDEFVKPHGDIKPIITVGTRYAQAWGPSVEEYFAPLIETLHDDIEDMWTGDNTCSAVTRDIMQWPVDQTAKKKPMLIWWNYPVNDYCGGKLLMGRMDCLANDLDNVSGFLTNPLSQVEASKPAIFSCADYAWNIGGFDAQASFDASFASVMPECREELAVLAQHVAGLKRTSMRFEESWDIEDAVKAYAENPAENAPAIAAECEKLIAACDKLLEKKDAPLMVEILPWVTTAKSMAKAGVLLMTNEITKEIAEEAAKLLNQIDLVHTLQGDLPADTGIYCLRPFMNALVTPFGFEVPAIPDVDVV